MKDAAALGRSEVPSFAGREMLLASLAELGLPPRLQNVLAARGCTLVGQLVQFTRDELLGLPYMGTKTVSDAERVLSEHSLRLGTQMPDWDQVSAIRARKELKFLLTDLRSEKMGSQPKLAFGLFTLEEAGLPQRFVNRLPLVGCELVGQLVRWTEEQLLEVESLGSGSVAQAKVVLERHALRFGMDMPDWDDAEAFSGRAEFLSAHPPHPDRKSRTVSPDVPEEVLLATLGEIGLPKRFLNHLPAKGLGLVGQLIQKTEAELLKRPNLGQKSLKEAQELLGTFGLSFGLKIPEWTDHDAKLRRAKLGSSIQQVLFDLRGGSASSQSSLEGEARQVLESVETIPRNVEMLFSLLGLDGLPPKTLESIGSPLGLTRERVRQIGDRAKSRYSVKWRPTPILDEAVRLLRQTEPIDPARFSALMTLKNLAQGVIHPQAIVELAAFTGKKIDIHRCLVAGSEFYCSESSEKLILDCTRELRRATSADGCTSLERLAVIAGVSLNETSRIRAVLEHLSETVWLGESRTWVMSSRPTRNRVVNLAEKVFTVTRVITLPELRRCLARSNRLVTVPSVDALAHLLEFKEIAVREADTMLGLREYPIETLGSVELPFLLAFREEGSPLSREHLEDICIDKYGVNPTSFWLYLCYTPIVTKLSTGVYALAGANVPPGSVENIRLRTKTTQASSEHGWTEDGKLWCVSPVDRITVSRGTRPIASYVAMLTEGDWTCSVSGGLVAGVATVEHGFIRGLGLAFSLAGAVKGDLARLTFDLPLRSVELKVGSSELMDDAANPPGYYEGVEDDPELDVDEELGPIRQKAGKFIRIFAG